MYAYIVVLKYILGLVHLNNKSLVFFWQQHYCAMFEESTDQRDCAIQEGIFCECENYLYCFITDKFNDIRI